MQDITWIIEIVITVLGLVLARYVIPALKNWVREKDLAELDYWLNMAVYAAEERYKEHAGSGALKFADVKSFLEAKGYTFDDETLAVLIEGAVKQTVNAWEGEGKGEAPAAEAPAAGV